MYYGIESKLSAAGYVRIEGADEHAIGEVMIALQDAYQAADDAAVEAWRDVHLYNDGSDAEARLSAAVSERSWIAVIKSRLGAGTLEADLLPWGKIFDHAEAADEIGRAVAAGSPVVVICNGEAAGIWCEGSVAGDYTPYTRAERVIVA